MVGIGYPVVVASLQVYDAYRLLIVEHAERIHGVGGVVVGHIKYQIHGAGAEGGRPRGGIECYKLLGHIHVVASEAIQLVAYIFASLQQVAIGSNLGYEGSFFRHVGMEVDEAHIVVCIPAEALQVYIGVVGQIR